MQPSFYYIMNYDQEILRVLCEAGAQGLSVHKIAMHVHNACNSLFNPVEFRDVYNYVRTFLARNSHAECSVVAKTSVRGRYRLNLNSNMGSQLMLQFKDEADSAIKHTAMENTDKSLSLF